MVTIRDNTSYIVNCYYTTITRWGVLLRCRVQGMLGLKEGGFLMIAVIPARGSERVWYPKP